ncbi:MAG: hypothetical protein HUN05_11630 [Desulfobacter sp.]|nr:MAG: hypothetical protein HUN05_11630 [Desulfobacter sp.]
MKKLMIAVAAIAMFASSAYAADWNFYGNARFYTFYESVDHNTPGTDDTDNTVWATSPNSRIGANVKVSDELSGRFEWDIASDIRIRLLYGEWNFGAGSLLVGQDWTPTNIFGSNQVGATELGLGGLGEMGGGRTGQLKLKMGGFRLALATPDVNAMDDTTGVTLKDDDYAGVAYDTEVKIPQILASYRFAGDNWSVKGVAGYQKFDLENQSVSSYIVGIGGDVAFGAATLYASIHSGENIGNLQNGAATGGALTDGSYAVVDGTTVIDNENLSCRFIVNYVFNDMISAEIGYGYTENELDTPGAVSDEAQSYYINLPINLAPGVILTPEIGVVDEKEDGQDKTTYYGAHWRINF